MILEKKRFKFALTGSSARKLKRGASDLLAGRTVEKFLFPFTHIELAEKFSLPEILNSCALVREHFLAKS